MKASEQKKRGYIYKREDLYTCIVFGYTGFDNLPVVMKYHNIQVDKPAVLDRFKKFVSEKFGGAKYFNVYGGQSGDYYKRIYL